MPQEQILKEFDEKFPQREIEGRINEDAWFGNAPAPNEIKSFLLFALSRQRQERDRELREQIVAIRESVAKAQGSHKYDSCYNNVLALLKNEN